MDPRAIGRRSGAGLSRRSAIMAGAAVAFGLGGCITRGQPSDLDGEIRIDGSNTVLPHSAAIAEEFVWRNNRMRIPVRGSGTGAGFQRFCAGETHVQNASREILEDEIGECEANGYEYLQLPVVLDGIAIITNPRNTWCECLTTDELHALWRSGSDVETWADLRPEWPDRPIQLYGRDPASGTFDYFTEAINDEVGNIRSDYSASSDTNVIVSGVRGDRDALGFGGAGYYYENEDDLNLVGVDAGDGCIEPTPETIETGEYRPLSRPMYLYLRRDQFHRREFRAFARFYFEPIDDRADRDDWPAAVTPTWTQWAARQVGFYAIPDEVVQDNVATLEPFLEGFR